MGTSTIYTAIEIDGGGAKGFIPLGSLIELERLTGRRVCDCADLMVGTSVGAILSAIAALGKMSAHDILGLMRVAMRRIFARQFPPRIPLYSREPFRAVWNATLGNPRLGDVRTPLVVTAVDECIGDGVYFTSDNPEHADLPLRTVVEYAFAAPLYFGGIPDPARKAVWLDGGTGIDNCPLLRTMQEMVRRRWLSGGNEAHILSLGCGHHHNRISYDHATSWWGRNWRQLQLYWSSRDGGLARLQSIRDRVEFAAGLDPALPEFSFDRRDVELPEALDKMDAVQYISEYERLGAQAAAGLNITPFLMRQSARAQAVAA